MDQGKPPGIADLPRPAGALRLAEVARLATVWSDILTVTDEKRTRAEGAPVSCDAEKVAEALVHHVFSR